MWSWSGAAYFCGTIVTTIGYGDLAPRTYYGRIIFMIYVIPGIALCGALLAELGVFIYNLSHRLWYAVRERRSRWFPEPIIGCGSSVHIGTLLFWLSYIILSFGLFLFIPSGIIYALKAEWSYFESIYFMMVTFTTVGFGNLTIHTNHWKFAILLINFIGWVELDNDIKLLNTI